MTDRRHFPRLETSVLWRPVGFIGPRRPAVDMSLGGMRVYCDELLKIGTLVELDMLLDNEPTTDLLAHVVRVEVLPAGSPAAFDVALEFVEMKPDVLRRLVATLTRTLGTGSKSDPREDEQQGHEVDRVEDQHGQQNLLQPPARAPIASGPEGERHVREEDGGEDKFLHGGALRNEARGPGPRNAPGNDRRRLNLLFVTPYLPSPPRFGGQMRLHGLISGMAASHDVSVLSFVDESEDQSEAVRETLTYCRSVATVSNPRYSASTASKRLLQLASLFSNHSYGALLHHQADLEEVLLGAIEQNRYDLVIFEFAQMATSGLKLRGKSKEGPAFVLDEHNIEYKIGEQTAQRSPSVVRRTYSAIDWRKVRDEELQTWANLDGCTLTSESDQEILLSEAPKTRTAVVPNGVDVDFFRPSRNPSATPDTMLFFGAIDYYPNTDGLRYFLSEVFPRLKMVVPQARLSIVGRRPPEEILAYRSPDVLVTGAVDDVRPYLESAAVVVVPLRLGSGTRLKILEAMAMGKAVVSTTLGAEGIDVVAGKNILLADDPATFASQIRRLLENPSLAARLGAAGRRLVVERYSWRSSVERLSTFYGEVLDARAAS